MSLQNGGDDLFCPGEIFLLVLGVTGTMSGSEGMKPQAKNVTPTFASQEVLPDEEYNCLSSVTVAAIPIAYTDNAQGGKTVTIG